MKNKSRWCQLIIFGAFLLPLLAIAATAVAQETPTRKVIRFGPDEGIIWGEVHAPNVTYVTARMDVKDDEVLKLDRSFIEELVETEIDDLR